MTDPVHGAGEPRYLGLAPYLYCSDATEALEWLVRVFGFTEKLRYVDADGAGFQATLLAGGSEIHLIDVGPDHWEAKGVSGPVGQLTVVYVDDVDSQSERVSVAASPPPAVSQPTDRPYGGRVLTVTDVGENYWLFWQEMSDKVELAAGWQVIRADR